MRKEGESVVGGDIIATIPETPLVEHRIMVPPGVKGRIKSIQECEAPVAEPVVVLEGRGYTVEIINVTGDHGEPASLMTFDKETT